MNKIGIVGGIGPASTAEYYMNIISDYKAIHGPEVNPLIVIDSVNMSIFNKALEYKNYNLVADMLLESISNLANAGADFAAIACNTAHIVWPLIKDRTVIPVISILDEICKYILNNHYKCIVILASGTTLRSGMFTTVLQDIGVTAITPDKDDIERIAKIIYPNLENGIILSKDRTKLKRIAEKYIKKYNADSVLLGCTELPLILKSNTLSVDIINTTDIHIKAIGSHL